MSALVIIDDFYLVGIALAEFETNAPTLIDRRGRCIHSPSVASTNPRGSLQNSRITR